MLCAAERGFAVAAVPRRDGRLWFRDAVSGDSVVAELRADLSIDPEHWSNYPLTVCRRVVRNFPEVRRGLELSFASDLPPAAGLSSSSALVVATFLALADVNDLAERAAYRAVIHDREDLAGYLAAIESGDTFRSLAGDHGVGTLGGSEDHTAIVCARADAIVQYTFAPVRLERDIAFPSDHVLIVAASGVVAEKTGNARDAYNRASLRAAAALHAWRRATGRSAPSLAAALGEEDAAHTRSSFADVVGRSADSSFSPESLLQRVEHFRLESAIVRAAADALARRDLVSLGALIDQSQANAERLLGNQIPETIALARSARELGATAASAFGAGFGGSVYALVRVGDADDFRARWMSRYAQAFPHRMAEATVFVTRAGPPASRLES